MEFKELQAKSKAELAKLAQEMREKVRGFRFSVSAKQLKNLREIRSAKKELAQILTLLNKQ
ncbi:MAG: 50S ribosomal protein L29 [Candidatus Komeilibacteria bacterium]|nr:50S ribosomal protein L29 [Candidatus Komeilibacteria bacterium]